MKNKIVPGVKKSRLSTVDRIFLGLLATVPVPLALAWYDMLNIASGLSSVSA